MIGVFDSGHGGLTIMRAIVDKVRRAGLVYLGDHGNAPYGNRGEDEIVDLTRRSVETLFRSGCRLVVLACNTASAVSLRSLQQEWLPVAYPDRRILGVVVPTVEALTQVPWHVTEPVPGVSAEGKTVIVFATQRTIASGAYIVEVRKRAPGVRIVQQACHGLAGAIEADLPAADLRRMVAGYVAEAMAQLNGDPVDGVVLGCTHYPLVSDAFAAALPAGTRMLRQPSLVAASLSAYLARHPEFADVSRSEPQFITSGDADAVGRLASRFYGEPVRFTTVSAALPEFGDGSSPPRSAGAGHR